MLCLYAAQSVVNLLFLRLCSEAPRAGEIGW